MKLPLEYETAGAEFDEPDRVYRYRLWRMWGSGSMTTWRTVIWLMLNPSTADETVLDPTLRRCERFSRDWGYDGFEVANIFALRSTDPRALSTHPSPVGERNDASIVEALGRADLIIVGWGTSKGVVQHRANAVKELLHGFSVMCLGRNGDGSPRHPLYLRADTKPEAFT